MRKLYSRQPYRKLRLYYTPTFMADAAKRSSAPDSSSGTPALSSTLASARPENEAVGAHYDTRLPNLPWSRRIQIPLIAAAVYSVIRTLGPTLRYEVLGWQHAERTYAAKKQCIWAFWHRVIIPVVWWARNRGIVVMNTTAFDGQWTRKVIEWLGFGTAQGSSSRGGLRGLAVMAKRLEQGLDCAFTIDGPRGPRYVAKPGPIVVARATGVPMSAFHIALDRAWILKTWDGFMIPKPFTRALLRVSRKIPVPPDGEDGEYLKELQAALDRVRAFAEENVGKKLPV